MPGLGGHLEVRGEAAFLLGTLQEPVAREWVRKLALATAVSWVWQACGGGKQSSGCGAWGMARPRDLE